MILQTCHSVADCQSTAAAARSEPQEDRDIPRADEDQGDDGESVPPPSICSHSVAEERALASLVVDRRGR